jgi:hypothetical protein
MKNIILFPWLRLVERLPSNNNDIFTGSFSMIKSKSIVVLGILPMTVYKLRFTLANHVKQGESQNKIFH